MRDLVKATAMGRNEAFVVTWSAVVWMSFGPLLASTSPVRSCVTTPSSSLSIGVVSNAGVIL